MRLLSTIILSGMCSGVAFAQSVDLGPLVFESGRFGVEVSSDVDSVFILERFDSGELDSPFTTPVGMALGQAGIPQELSEYLASGEAKGFFRITGADLATFEADTDSDGIKDRIELQAGEFINPLDVTDASQADVFSVVPDVSLSAGVPGPGAGSIESAHFIDLYHFDGSAGSGLFVDAVSSAPELGSLQYQIIDPYGNVVKASRFGFGDLGPVNLLYDGEYLLLVGDKIRTGTGEYAINLTEIPTPQSFNISIGETISADQPETGAGRIEAPGAFDSYLFVAAAGDKVFLDTLSFSGVNSIRFRLLDPTGSELADRPFNTGDMGTVELPFSGIYTIEVGEIDDDGTGTYSIGLTAIPEPETFLISIGDSISDGVPDAGAGNIESPGVFDRYTFAGTAGQTIFIDRVGFSGVNTVDYKLFDPSGVELAAKQFNTGDIAYVELPAAGTYTLEVGESTNDSTGTYEIAIYDIPPADEFSISIGDSISDGVPGAGAGNIESPGVFDRYTFAGTAGQPIFIDRVGFSGVNTIDYKLFDPLGNELAAKQFNTGDIAYVELPANGTYTLEVGELTNDSTGTYEITIYGIPAADEFMINIGDTIGDGVPGAGAGNIEIPGSFDRYTFSGTAGQSIFVDRGAYSGVNTVDYKLFDPAGNEIASTQFNFGDLGTIELPSTGTYTLEVGETSNDGTGVYTITLYDIPVPDEFDINIGESISENVPGVGAGNIEVPGSFDHYTFTGTAGQSIFVDRGAYSGVNTVDYKLYDPLGAQIASTQFNFGDLGTVELPFTGTYTLEVGESSNDEIGTYTISLTDIPAPYQAAISYGDVISQANPGGGSGRIEVPGAYDRYAFTGSAGDSVEIEVAFRDSELDFLNFRLLDPSGVEMATKAFIQGNLGPIELPATGTYTLEVGEADNASTGIYSLVLVLSAP